MELRSITPLILTYNEEANLGRVLERLRWASRVIVLDSFSTDATMTIAQSYPTVHVVQRVFDSHEAQWNFGVQLVESEWVLAIDADYVLPREFVHELAGLDATAQESGYYCCFRYLVAGKPLRTSLYPPRLSLFRRERGRYVQDGHTQTLQLSGTSGHLRTAIHHDDRKPLRLWIAAQVRYASLEVAKLTTSQARGLSMADRLRRVPGAAPLVMPFYCLIVRGLIRDHWRGVFYTMQRTFAELLLSLMLVEHRLTARLGGTDYRKDSSHNA